MKISVIIPVYNTGEYLEECLESIINQTLKDIEIICVNDGSCDNSADILNRYADRDERIIIINNNKCVGAGNSRNKGISAAKGSYIHFMDSDDCLLFNSSYQNIWNKVIQNNNPDIIRFKTAAFSDEENYIKSASELNGFNVLKFETFIDINTDTKDILYGLPVTPWSGLINREFLLKTGIKFPDYKVCNDRAFFIETLLKSKKLFLADDFVVKHRINNKNSLFGIRGKYFSCMFNSFNRIKDFCIAEKIPDRLTKAVILNELRDIFSFYEKHINDDNGFEIYKETVLFLKTLNKNSLDLFPEIENMQYYPLFKNLYSISSKDIENSYKKSNKKVFNKKFVLSNIFSARNIDTHKVITILGLKLKFKNKNLVLTQKIKNLEYEIANIKQQSVSCKKELLYKIHKYCPDEKRELALKDWYFESGGGILDLENPKTFNEKIQWLKLFDSTPLKAKLADKYQVRFWIKEKIGEEYLIPLLGVWNSFDEIDFDKLPDKFVLKCNHGCAYNIIVKDKSTFDKKAAKEKINYWMHEDFGMYSFQMHYCAIPKKIIAEEFIGSDKEEMIDYKFWCFDGKVQYIQYLTDRNKGLKMAFFDTGWNKLDFVTSYQMIYDNIKKPECLEKMILISEILSQGFSFVRVDLYIIPPDKIKFGEMTFTPRSGMCQWNVPYINNKLGDLIKLNNI